MRYYLYVRNEMGVLIRKWKFSSYKTAKSIMCFIEFETECKVKMTRRFLFFPERVRFHYV